MKKIEYPETSECQEIHMRLTAACDSVTNKCRQIEYNDKKENLLKVSCLPCIKVACDRDI